MLWSWQKSGIALAMSFLLAIALVKPIGVSTQFVILDGMIASAFSDNLVVEDATSKSGYASSNAYLDKSGGKYAKSIAEPLNYSFVFVLSMIFGGLLAAKTSKTKQPQLPEAHVRRFGNRSGSRYLLVFIGGVIVLFGARLAGGCTSGHMMSGIMQTSVSGYLFALAAFATAVPTALFVYAKKSKGTHGIHSAQGVQG